MADFDYSIGGTDRKAEGSEAIAEISQNRTLFVQKLSNEAPFAPDFVQNLSTPEEVFAHFKPSVPMEFENEDGSTKEEELHFTNLADFGSKGISNQSKFIQELANQEDTYLKLVKELKSNKAIQTALQNKESKQAFLTALAAMIKELEDAGA
jgi:predicted component of type VI protein secretion system